MPEHSQEREKLIKRLIELGFLKSPRVIEAFRAVPREEFVPRDYRKHAYVDEPLPIGHNQTISQPLTVAAMTEALDVKSGHRVLEVGAGSGYQAAILSVLAGKNGKVITTERIYELFRTAQNNLKAAGLDKNATVVFTDGSKGYAPEAPYDRILVAAQAPKVPEALLQQLKNGGKLVIPVGSEMFMLEKEKNKTKKKSLGYYAFVPLIGEEGYRGQ